MRNKKLQAWLDSNARCIREQTFDDKRGGVSFWITRSGRVLIVQHFAPAASGAPAGEEVYAVLSESNNIDDLIEKLDGLLVRPAEPMIQRVDRIERTADRAQGASDA